MWEHDWVKFRKKIDNENEILEVTHEDIESVDDYDVY